MIIDGVMMEERQYYVFTDAGWHEVEYVLTRNTLSTMTFNYLDDLYELYVPPQITAVAAQALRGNPKSSLTLYNTVTDLHPTNDVSSSYPDTDGIQYAGDIAFSTKSSNLPSNLVFKPNTRCLAGLELGSPYYGTDNVTSVTIPKYCVTIQYETFTI